MLRFDLNQRSVFFHDFWAWRTARPYPFRCVGYGVFNNCLDFIWAGFHHDQSAGSDLVIRHGLRGATAGRTRLAFGRGGNWRDVCWDSGRCDFDCGSGWRDVSWGNGRCYISRNGRRGDVSWGGSRRRELNRFG